MNRRFAGQILRILGLAIEMLGILAAALSSRGGDGAAGAAGGLSSQQIWIVVGAGFVVWLVGNLLTYWPGLGSTGRKPGNGGKNELRL
jgi:hypothetical protein